MPSQVTRVIGSGRMSWPLSGDGAGHCPGETADEDIGGAWQKPPGDKRGRGADGDRKQIAPGLVEREEDDQEDGGKGEIKAEAFRVGDDSAEQVADGGPQHPGE